MIPDYFEIPGVCYFLYCVLGPIIGIAVGAILDEDTTLSFEACCVLGVFGAIFSPLVVIGVVIWGLVLAVRILGTGFCDLYLEIRPEKPELPRARTVTRER